MIYHIRLVLAASLLMLIVLTSAHAQPRSFTLQVEAMDTRAQALELVQRLKASGVDAYYLKSDLPGRGVVYRVRVGSYVNSAAAQQEGQQMRRAQLIRDYFVARYEGAAIEDSPAVSTEAAYRFEPANLTRNDLATRPIPARAAAPAKVAKAAPARAARPRAAAQTRIMPRATYLATSGLGNVALDVPVETDELGSCFDIANGSVLTAVTSFGTFTMRDRSVGAVIPYPGLEAKLKFKTGVAQEWTPPQGVISADLMGMQRNGDFREFHTNGETLKSFGVTGGKIAFDGLPTGDYMIKARTSRGCVFLPLSVRE